MKEWIAEIFTGQIFNHKLLIRERNNSKIYKRLPQEFSSNLCYIGKHSCDTRFNSLLAVSITYISCFLFLFVFLGYRRLSVKFLSFCNFSIHCCAPRNYSILCPNSPVKNYSWANVSLFLFCPSVTSLSYSLSLFCLIVNCQGIFTFML